ITVRLATAPPGEVSVNVARTSGDSDLVVNQGANLSFTSSNWFIPQVVTVNAATDSDSTDDTAALTISAAGFSSEGVTVHALDLPTVPPSLSIVSPPGISPVQIRLS